MGIDKAARLPSRMPTKPVSNKWTLVGGMCISELTKKAAVKRATRGISSSRSRQAPKQAKAAATAKPAACHPGVNTPSLMWAAKSMKAVNGGGRIRLWGLQVVGFE